jgi:hypothetical protein
MDDVLKVLANVLEAHLGVLWAALRRDGGSPRRLGTAVDQLPAHLRRHHRDPGFPASPCLAECPARPAAAELTDDYQDIPRRIDGVLILPPPNSTR